MDLHLSNSVAVIAGGARGIGLAIAKEFAAEGARIALLDRDSEVVSEAKAVAKACNIEGAGWRVDVTAYDEVGMAADRVLERFGRIDHVVYAVGIGSGKFGFPFWNLQPGDWPRVLEINVQGAVHVLHAF